MCSMPLFWPSAAANNPLILWLLSHGFLLLLFSVSKLPSSYKDTIHRIKAYSSNPLLAHLNLITSAETLFSDKVTFVETKGQDLNIFWRGGGQLNYIFLFILCFSYSHHITQAMVLCFFPFNVKLCEKFLTQFSTQCNWHI